MGEVVVLPGVDVLTVPGTPRPDIAAALRNVAGRAERGEFQSVVLIAAGPNVGTVDLLSTPELHFYEVLGAMEAIKPEIMARRAADRRSHTAYEPDGA